MVFPRLFLPLASVAYAQCMHARCMCVVSYIALNSLSGIIEMAVAVAAVIAVPEMAGRMASTAFTFHNGRFFCIPKQRIAPLFR